MNKKIKIIISCAFASTIIITPLVTTISILKNNKFENNIQYSFLDQKFKTKKEAFDYANTIAKSYENETKSPIKWSLKDNNELKTFSNQKDVFSYLNQFIEEKAYTSFTNDLKTDAFKALLPSEILKMNFNSNIKTQTIYRGKDNSIHFSEEDAKKSYLQIHEVYYFNGLFFRTKEELGIWLEKNISNFNSNSSIYEILFQDIDGTLSMPIRIDDLKKDFANNKTPASIEYFVKTANKPYFKYENKELNKTFFVSENNLNEISKYYNPKYTQITSNQGKGNYIIDTSTDDEASLIGPYYIKSGTEIKQITDRTKWKKIDGTNYSIADKLKERNIISNFMNLLLANPYNESKRIINTFFSIKDIQNQIDSYFNLLYKNCPEIYKSLDNLFQTMKQGKRYGEFLKIPVLFLHTLDQMIYYNVDQLYIDETRKIYSLICDYYDEQLYSMVPKKFLLKKNKEEFSFKKIFGINNQNLDLNYDVDTLVGEVIYEYPNLLEFANFISYFEMGLSKLNTLENIEFSAEHFFKTYKLKLNPELLNEYKLVWNALNSSNFENLYENIIKINNDIDPSRAYYYINNFILQQKSNDITKTLISYWLDKTKSIQQFKLSGEKIKYLDQIIKNNEMFNIKTTGEFYNENFQFLKSLYNQNNEIEPILFSRLLMFMQFYNNTKKLSELSNSVSRSDKYINLKESINIFMNKTILNSYSFISSNNVISSFSRTNINYDVNFKN